MPVFVFCISGDVLGKKVPAKSAALKGRGFSRAGSTFLNRDFGRPPQNSDFPVARRF
jgi:hypothetical protein